MTTNNTTTSHALVILTLVLALSAGVAMGVTETVNASPDTQNAAESGGGAAVSSQDDGQSEGNLTKITITSSSGFIAFDESTLEDAQSEGLSFPGAFVNESREVLIEGAITEEGTWEIRTFRFPTLQTESGIEADVTTTDFAGEIDREEGLLTLQGNVTVSIEGDSFSYDIGATTKESGALSGSLSLDNTTGNATGDVTIVDNEYTVDTTTGNGIIDQTLGLPIEQSGNAWLEIEGKIEIVSGASEDDFAENGGESDDETESKETGNLFTNAGLGLGLATLTVSALLVVLGLVRRLTGVVDRDEQLRVE